MVNVLVTILSLHRDCSVYSENPNRARNDWFAFEEIICPYRFCSPPTLMPFPSLGAFHYPDSPPVLEEHWTRRSPSSNFNPVTSLVLILTNSNSDLLLFLQTATLTNYYSYTLIYNKVVPSFCLAIGLWISEKIVLDVMHSKRTTCQRDTKKY